MHINNQDTLKATKPQLMEFHRHGSVVFQGGGLLNNMNIFDNIALPLRYNTNMSEKEIHAKIDPIIERLGLGPYLTYMPSRLILSIRKMVGIARCMSTDPQLIQIRGNIELVSRWSQHFLPDPLIY